MTRWEGFVHYSATFEVVNTTLLDPNMPRYKFFASTCLNLHFEAGEQVQTQQAPLLFAHPKLPPVNIESPAIAIQIVPTVLDLLVESSSLRHCPSRR